ncbi:hypothetical protein A6J33_003350 [Pantoea sp. FDAARGOS_194]|uniref:hypothetical protein n=1 Tax=Pantoea TaxID=53335 RepID=UPI000BB57F8C|nr:MULTISPECIES: hypothetical protein [Pantoea]PNK69942.1 hypothetical protein A6J33_003350 [Pantoea sp. FDAARGOS_194]
MHTQNVNVAASESPKTWGNGPKICVSANDLRTRWHVTGKNGEKVTPSEGKHFPARNGSYGTDVLLLDETDVSALMAAGHTALPCVASSGGGMTALYDLGENAAGRFIIVSRGQIFYRSASWQEARREYMRRASAVRAEEAKAFLTACTKRVTQGWIITWPVTSHAALSRWKTRSIRCQKIR